MNFNVHGSLSVIGVSHLKLDGHNHCNYFNTIKKIGVENLRLAIQVLRSCDAENETRERMIVWANRISNFSCCMCHDLYYFLH
jgi:hypothetical protein